MTVHAEIDGTIDELRLSHSRDRNLWQVSKYSYRLANHRASMVKADQSQCG